MKNALLLFVFAVLIYGTCSAQPPWQQGGNNPVINNRLGTNTNVSLDLVTDASLRAQFTTGNALTSFGGNGDGLRIFRPSGLLPSNPLQGNLSLFTSNNAGGDETHVVWGQSGQIIGQALRFEQYANFNGFYFNTTTQEGVYKFGREGALTAVVGTNNFWRIGMQLDNIFGAVQNANRRLEVADAQPQLRLTTTPALDVFCDFNSQAFGLDITPMNSAVRTPVFVHQTAPVNPAVMLNVNGNGRFRYIPQGSAKSLILGMENNSDPNDLTFRRLDFPGVAGDVLHGDGTWGPVISSDDQNLTSASINCSTNVMTIGIENGTPVNVDLSCIAGGGSPANIHNGASTSTIAGYTNFHAFGQNLGQTGDPARLRNSREVPMNNFNIEFTDDGISTYGSNEIGIGTTNPTAKLHVNLDPEIISNVVTYGGRVDNHARSPSAKGMYVSMKNHPSLSYGYEADIDATTDVTSQNQGFRTHIKGGKVNEGLHVWVKDGTIGNTGVYAVASSQLTNANQTVGVIGFAYDGGNANKGGDFRGISQTGNPLNNYGVYTLAGGTSTNSYGIYASSIGGTVSNYAGFFNGNVQAGSMFIYSDKKLKKNIKTIGNATELLMKLKPSSYEFRTDEFAQMNLDQGNQYGLIAQDVEQILPELVKAAHLPEQYDEDGNVISEGIDYKSVNYTGLVPVLIAGMQEQQAEMDSKNEIIEDLNDRLARIEKCLNNLLPVLCEINATAVGSTPQETQQQLAEINIELNDGQNIILNQNVPNPFAEKTVITYAIPESVGKAQIHFYDGAGVLINSVELNERGNGQINVFANDLSSGVYTYALVADGQVVDVKKMVKTKR